MPRRRESSHLHGAISIILDRLNLDLPSPHGEEHRVESDEKRLSHRSVGGNLSSRGQGSG